MARTTVTEVRAIISTNLDDDAIEEYIASASTTLTGWFSGVTTATEEMLTEVERWLTAHLITMSRERQAKEEGAGGAYIRYVGLYGTGLKTTSYGQTAMEIDYTNTLKRISGQGLSFFAVKEGE